MKMILVALLALLAGCATAPKVYDYQKTWTMECERDDAWTATVQLFAEKGWPIATLEKDSGIIVSDWVNIGSNTDFADFGSPGLAFAQRREAKFNVFIREGEGGPSLTVNTSFRELRVFDTQSFYQDGNSTGVMEANLHSEILARMN